MGFDVLSYAIGLQAGKASGGGSSEKVLLAEQTIEGFDYASNYDAYLYNLIPSPFVLTAGETYFIKWDGTVYECVAQDLSAMMAGAVAVGNLSPFGLSGNNEPFIINYAASSNVSSFLAFDVETSHRVKIYQKVSGGGSVEGIHYVTFMSEDGSTELYKRPVADGDDCADPVKRGLMDEPEKESTVQYSYTYMGWATEPNGGVNDAALKAVTADKKVYANFAAVLRYYTITYYDSDGTTVLKTESLAYGTTPVYVAEKDGYNFEGWVPAFATVTGNASYVAQFSEKLTFAGASWADIAEISEAGEAANYFKVGDTKQIAFNGATITLVVAGFNHDDLADGSGKAGMSILCKTVPSIGTRWHTDETYDSRNYYDNSAINNAMTEWKNYLPQELASVIKTVKKDIDATDSSGTGASTKKHTCDLFPLSIAELGCTMTNTKNFSNLGTRYALFPAVTCTGTYPEAILPTIRREGETKYFANYWLRQMKRMGVISAAYVSATKENMGTASGYNQPSTNSLNVWFGFCV